MVFPPVRKSELLIKGVVRGGRKCKDQCHSVALHRAKTCLGQCLFKDTYILQTQRARRGPVQAEVQQRIGE